MSRPLSDTELDALYADDPSRLDPDDLDVADRLNAWDEIGQSEIEGTAP